VHRPGKHCASTVLSDLTHFYGPGLSEPFCLGLGAGLGFYYVEGELFSPTRMIMTRSQDLEANFFRILGQEFDWKYAKTPEQGWLKVKKLIDEGIPVLLHADIFYLDHYKSKTHFPLHVILLWGYDDAKAAAYVADTGWEGLIELPLASLSKARYSKLTYYESKGGYFPALLPARIFGLEDRARKAILTQAEQISGNCVQGNFGCGYPAMRRVAERIQEWPGAKDASWCFRWAYQTIERRGTGGGAFRKLYADFLKEAGKLNPEIAEFASFHDMQIIAAKWSSLSLLLKEISEKNPIPAAEVRKASKIWSEIADREQSFFERAKQKLRATG